MKVVRVFEKGLFPIDITQVRTDERVPTCHGSAGRHVTSPLLPRESSLSDNACQPPAVVDGAVGIVTCQHTLNTRGFGMTRKWGCGGRRGLGGGSAGSASVRNNDAVIPRDLYRGSCRVVPHPRVEDASGGGPGFT